MKKTFLLNKPILLAIFLLLLALNTTSFSQPNLSNEKLTLLKVVAGMNYTFKNHANEIWPGYDLSVNPYIVYLPDEFVLYVNANKPPEGFEPYPSNWPDLGTTVYIYYGVYKDLIGQFSFDYQIDTITTFAMGLPKNLLFSFDNPSYILLSSTIHEGFHQYQHSHFGEIPWAREEKYPILNVENTALASLEMQILEDALKAMFDKNSPKMEVLLKQFAAVRDYRWKLSDSYIRKYEQGQEINEGTARYVEMKSVGCFLKLDYNKINNNLLTDIEKDHADISIKKLLIEDMESRLTGIAVAPEDMLRNRIYPVGAFLGFMLDALQIDWKTKFQSAESEVSFHDMLIEHFPVDTTHLENYLISAKKTYHYQNIYSAAKNLIVEYSAGYEKALEEFNNQPGKRVELILSNNGIQRNRSSKSKKWIVKNGRITLCLNYNLYILKSFMNNNLHFEIHDKALFDENDWETNMKKVVFFSDNIFSIIIDNKSIELTQDVEQEFKAIKIEGNDFNFEAKIKGKVLLNKNNEIIINLEQ
ncbi:MAG TPA: hypothetical protein DEQ09_03410 [Bacteroidales bacterium]|nr:hypothetical protein [Bacteroidales bacterium]